MFASPICSLIIPLGHIYFLVLLFPAAMPTGDNELRCNNFVCRCIVAQQGKAVVTTCSREFLYLKSRLMICGSWDALIFDILHSLM